MSAVPRYAIDYSAGIPDELLLLVFDFLTQPTLLRAAHVSCRWRRAARSHPRFYRYISLDCDCRPGREEAAIQLSAWVGVINESLELGTPVGIRLSVSEHGTYGVHATDAATVRNIVLPRLRNLLAQTVYLDLRMQGLHAHALLSALTSPAPRLFSIRITLSGRILSPSGNLSVPLFGGYAPNLRKLELSNVPLDHAQTHRAFRAVQELSISPCSYRLIFSLPGSFPSLSTLNMHAMKYKAPTTLLSSKTLGCTLRALTVRALTHLPRPAVELINLRPGMNVHVEFMQKSIDWKLDIAPLVAGLPDPLELCITHHWFILWVVHIRSTHGARTIRAPTMRSVLRSTVPQTPLLLFGVLALLPRVSTLAIDGVALPQVAACLSAEFPQIRSLTISFAPPSPSAAVLQWTDFLAWISENTTVVLLRCTGLVSLTLSWRDVPPETYHDAPPPPAIAQSVLLNLATAFGISVRVELCLYGVLLQRTSAGDAAFNSAFDFEYTADNSVDEAASDGDEYLDIGMDL